MSVVHTKDGIVDSIAMSISYIGENILFLYLSYLVLLFFSLANAKLYRTANAKL